MECNTKRNSLTQIGILYTDDKTECHSFQLCNESMKLISKAILIFNEIGAVQN